MAIPVDVAAEQLFYPTKGKLVYDDQGKTKIVLDDDTSETTGPPSTYEQWRDPNTIVRETPSIPSSPSYTSLKPDTAHAYSPSIEMTRPEYMSPDIAEYRNPEARMIEPSMPQRSVDEWVNTEPVQSSDMVFHPMYGWTQRGSGRKPMILPGRSQPIVRSRVMPSRWR